MSRVKYGELNDIDQSVKCPHCSNLFFLPTAEVPEHPVEGFLPKYIDVEDEHILWAIIDACRTVSWAMNSVMEDLKKLPQGENSDLYYKAHRTKAMFIAHIRKVTSKINNLKE